MSTLEADNLGIVAKCDSCGQLNRLTYEKLGQEFRCGKCRTNLKPPSEPLEIQSEPVFGALTDRSALPVLVDFWAPWCGPCKMVAPELVKVATEGSGRWLVTKVNSDELAGVAQRFQIQAIPTLVLFRNGREIRRQSGAMPVNQIRRFIEQAA